MSFTRGRIFFAAVLVLAAWCPGAMAEQMAPPAQPGWQPVNCSQSKITSSLMDACYVGPISRGRSTGRRGGNCKVLHSAIEGQSQTSAIYVRAAMISSDSPGNCVPRDDAGYATQLKSDDFFANGHASNWSDPKQIGNASGMYFTFFNRKCFAFYKLGNFFKLYGYVCGTDDSKSISDAQIGNIISMIHVNN